MRARERFAWVCAAVLAFALSYSVLEVWPWLSSFKISDAAPVSPPSRPRHVDVDFPVRVDVTFNVRPVTSESEGNFVYRGTADYTFTNNSPSERRIRLPLLRASYAKSNSTQYVSHAELPAEWKTPRTIVLSPGRTATITVPVSGDSDTPLSRLTARSGDERVALAFGVPEGEDPDRYVVGTVLTEPVKWVAAAPASQLSATKPVKGSSTE